MGTSSSKCGSTIKPAAGDRGQVSSRPGVLRFAVCKVGDSHIGHGYLRPLRGRSENKLSLSEAPSGVKTPNNPWLLGWDWSSLAHLLREVSRRLNLEEGWRGQASLGGVSPVVKVSFVVMATSAVGLFLCKLKSR